MTSIIGKLNLKISQRMTSIIGKLNFKISQRMTSIIGKLNFKISQRMTSIIGKLNFKISQRMTSIIGKVVFRRLNVRFPRLNMWWTAAFQWLKVDNQLLVTFIRFILISHLLKKNCIGKIESPNNRFFHLNLINNVFYLFSNDLFDQKLQFYKLCKEICRLNQFWVWEKLIEKDAFEACLQEYCLINNSREKREFISTQADWSPKGWPHALLK